jgi:S-methylmethionine-dependent homocysteine/selenocysteine methylase
MARIRILDGGVGSELRRRGIALSPLCWSAEANLTQADLLTTIHEDYIRAGADIVTANTFATSRFVLAGAGLDAQFEEINRSAISAARRAAEFANRDVAVAASISCLPPAFDAGAYPSADAEYAAYAELVGCFAENHVDLVLLEMMQDTEHAPRACRAVGRAGLPFWIGVSCRRADSDGRLVAFDEPERPFAAVLDAVLGFEPEGVAIMHSPVDAVGPALAELGRRWQGPTGGYAEIAYPEDPADSGAERMDTATYAVAAQEWLARGAALIGGCCGTTPAHIAALAALARP